MSLIKALFLVSSGTSVLAVIPTPRYNGGCAAVSQQLYCYGGTSNQQPTADHYVFDLSNDFIVGNSISAWNNAPSGSDFQVEPNSLFSIASLNDSYIVHGGLGYASTSNFLKNTTTMYNTTSKSWSVVHGINQTTMIPSREETATIDPLNRLWIWGGISDNTTALNISKPVYHNEFQTLNLNTMTWSFPNNKTTTSSHPSFPQPRLAHTATLTGSGQSILYIGGLEVDENGKLSPAPMNEILEYNITNSNWTLHKSPVNSTIPASRRLHSATLVPNTDQIFVYGGSLTDASQAVLDYSYLLNTTSFEWTPVNILNSGAGPRFGHSAVLYKEKSLFIVFGADGLGTLRNDFFVLDITHWQWVSYFKANGVYPSAPSNSINTVTASSSPTSTSTTNSNSHNQSSLANTTIPPDFMKTLYLLIGITIFFTLL